MKYSNISNSQLSLQYNNRIYIFTLALPSLHLQLQPHHPWYTYLKSLKGQNCEKRKFNTKTYWEVVIIGRQVVLAFKYLYTYVCQKWNSFMSQKREEIFHFNVQDLILSDIMIVKKVISMHTTVSCLGFPYYLLNTGHPFNQPFCHLNS